jgi:hypothetical protein
LRVIRYGLAVLSCCVLGLAQAEPSTLTLPCYSADGVPLAQTEIVAIRKDDLEAGRAPMKQAALDGRCSIALEAGLYWVKAQSPEHRSVPILLPWPATSVARTLTMIPMNGSDSAWQQALGAMVQRDQEVRNQLAEAQRSGDADRVAQFQKEMQAIDDEHQSQLRRWLAERGFPRAKEVGFSGVGDAWLLLQHASQIIPDILPALRAAAERGELPRSSLALTEDRARMQLGQPQRYGSQLQIGPDGKPSLYPLESPEQVDAWREAMDLEPLADYLKRFGL